MSIDAKGIQLLVWRMIRFSGSCCYKFVRKYPVVSGFFIFVFFLYIFFPSVFYFLVYSSPVLVCAVVSIRCYLKTQYPESQWIKKKDSEERSSADVKFGNRSDGPSLRTQKSVRRNARKEVLEWDGKHSEERDMLILRSPCDSLSNETNFLGENSKIILDGKGSSSREQGECSSYNENGNDRALDDPNLVFDNEISKLHRVSGDSFQGPSGKGPDDDGGGEVEVESLEEADEDGNKAVEWTEDDQKNLMDLGLSELERNKRLESLIAKRRAKNLFKMIGESLMSLDSVPTSQIARILIAKNNILGASNNPNEEGLQMPGSAPSILLPTQNPFDLPYDPFEEKPNLTADSFQQEFMAANQKEMLFCRHESFCHGPFFTLATTQNPNDAKLNPYYSAEKRLVEGPTTARFKRQPDEGGHLQLNSSGIGSDIDLIELGESNHNEAIKSSEGKKEKIVDSANNRIEIEGEKMEKPHDLGPGLDNGSEVRMETDSIKNNDSCYSSSSEATEPVLDQTSKSPGIHNDRMRKALILAIPPRRKTVNRLPNDSSPSPSERRRADFNLFYSIYKRQCHTPTFSVASDLQVEVSEVGSPPLTADGTVSSVDGDSVTYDGDVDRDINSDSEELWGGSFNLSRAEANRERLKELDDIIEEGSVDIEFSGLKMKPEELIASISPFEEDAKQHLNSTSSLYSIIDITETSASNPTYINSETHEDVKKIDEEVEGFRTSNVSDTLSPESPSKTMHVMEKSMVYSPSESCFEKPEKLFEPQQKPTEELNNIYDVEPITQGDANSLYLKSSENRENGALLLIKPVALREMIKPADANNLGSRDYRHGNLETSYKAKSTMESEKEVEESQPSKYIEEDTENVTKHNTGDAPNAVQSGDNLKSVPDSIVDQNIADDNVSGVKQSLGDSITMALNQRLVLEQIPVSSCSSPMSVLPQNILEDQRPISEVEQRTQRDMPQSVREDIVRDNLADDQAHENSTFNTPQISQKLVENSVDHSSGNCSLGTLEESSNMTENSTKYSTVHNMNEVTLEDTNVKEDPSIKSSEGESQILKGLKDAKELSKSSRESNPRSIQHLEGRSEKMIEYDIGIDPSKSEKENAKAGDPETMEREEEPTNSPRKVIGEGSIFVNINNSAVNEKEEGETLRTNEGDSQFSIRLEDIRRPEKSNESDDYASIVESAREREKSAVEVDHICDVNESSTDNVTNKEILTHVLEGEDELRMLSRLEAVMEPSKTIVATSAGPVEDIEQESKRLAKAEANAWPINFSRRS